MPEPGFKPTTSTSLAELVFPHSATENLAVTRNRRYNAAVSSAYPWALESFCFFVLHKIVHNSYSLLSLRFSSARRPQYFQCRMIIILSNTSFQEQLCAAFYSPKQVEPMQTSLSNLVCAFSCLLLLLLRFVLFLVHCCFTVSCMRVSESAVQLDLSR